MATCLSVIKRAMRMIAASDAGQEPDADQARDGLEALQGLYTHLIAGGAIGRLTDVAVTSSPYEAKENERLFNDTGGALTVTKPTTVETCTDEHPRPVRDFAVIVIAGASPQTWVYDAHLAAWVQIEGLALAAEAPWSARLSTGLAALLAAHIITEYRDGAPSPTVLALAGQAMSVLTMRPDGQRPPAQTEYF